MSTSKANSPSDIDNANDRTATGSPTAQATTVDPVVGDAGENVWLEGPKILGAPRMASNAELIRALMQSTRPPYPEDRPTMISLLTLISEGLESDGLETPDFETLEKLYAERVHNFPGGKQWTWTGEHPIAPLSPPAANKDIVSDYADARIDQDDTDVIFGTETHRTDEDPMGRRSSAGLLGVDIESWELGANRKVSDVALPDLEVDGGLYLPPANTSLLTETGLHATGTGHDTLYFYMPSRWHNGLKKVSAPDLLFNARAISRETARTFVALGWLTPESFAVLSPHFNNGGMQKLGPLQAVCFGDTLGDRVGKDQPSLNNVTEWCSQLERMAAFDWARCQYRMAAARSRATKKGGANFSTTAMQQLVYFSHHVARISPYNMAAVKAGHKLTGSLLSSVTRAKKADELIESIDTVFNSFNLAYAISFDKSKHDIETWKTKSQKTRQWLFTDDIDKVTEEIVEERLNGAARNPSEIVKAGFTTNFNRFKPNAAWLASIGVPKISAIFSETGEEASERQRRELAKNLPSTSGSVVSNPEVEFKVLSVSGLSTAAKRKPDPKAKAKPKADLKGKAKTTVTEVPDEDGFATVKSKRQQKREAAVAAKTTSGSKVLALRVPMPTTEEVDDYMKSSFSGRVDHAVVSTVLGFTYRKFFNEHQGFFSTADTRMLTPSDCEFHGMEVPLWVTKHAAGQITLENAAENGVPKHYRSTALGRSILSLELEKRVRPGPTNVSVSTDNDTKSPFDHEIKFVDLQSTTKTPEVEAPESDFDSDSDDSKSVSSDDSSRTYVRDSAAARVVDAKLDDMRRTQRSWLDYFKRETKSAPSVNLDAVQPVVPEPPAERFKYARGIVAKALLPAQWFAVGASSFFTESFEHPSTRNIVAEEEADSKLNEARWSRPYFYGRRQLARFDSARTLSVMGAVLVSPFTWARYGANLTLNSAAPADEAGKRRLTPTGVVKAIAGFAGVAITATGGLLASPIAALTTGVLSVLSIPFRGTQANKVIAPVAVTGACGGIMYGIFCALHATLYGTFAAAFLWTATCVVGVPLSCLAIALSTFMV